MKLWIKRSLLGIAALATLGSFAACAGHRHHAQGWSEERITEMRGKAVERISGRLALNAEQKQKLERVADEMLAARLALHQGSADPRTELKALLANDKLDRSKAQALLDQKTQAVQSNGPKLVAALGEFYDSLNPAQQQQVRELMDKRGGRGWWGRG